MADHDSFAPQRVSDEVINDRYLQVRELLTRATLQDVVARNSSDNISKMDRPDGESDVEFARRIIATYLAVIGDVPSPAERDFDPEDIGSDGPGYPFDVMSTIDPDYAESFERTVKQAPAATDDVVKDAIRYRRLQVLGVAPGYTKHLEKGEVMRFSNLDEFVDNDLKTVPNRGDIQVSSQPGTTNLRALVDWVYLYATEGRGWPDAATIVDPLLTLASGGAPSQADADHFKAGGSLRAALSKFNITRKP